MVTTMDRCEGARLIEELQAGAAAARADLERRPADWLLPPSQRKRCCPPSQRKTPARLRLSPTPHHLPKRNSSTASPTASLHCWHSAMRRSPSWAASSTQCCRSSALARAATSSTCPRISGGATRHERSGNFRPQSTAWEPQKSTGGGRKCSQLFFEPMFFKRSPLHTMPSCVTRAAGARLVVPDG